MFFITHTQGNSMIYKKRNRGTIKNWQLHHLSFTQKQLDDVYPNTGVKPIVFTGTIVKDPSHRRKPGDHMKSSLVVKINKKNKTIETLNSVYKYIDSEGGDVFPDLGDAVMDIFY